MARPVKSDCKLTKYILSALLIFIYQFARATLRFKEIAMSAPIQITYLFDPLCGWCYGASTLIEQLVARPDFAVELAPTGLFAGEGARPMDDGFAAYAWTNDQRISRLSGQPFSEAYRRDVLGDRTRLFDSGPATLALTAVALTAPDREFAALKGLPARPLCRGPRQHGHVRSVGCALRDEFAGGCRPPGEPRHRIDRRVSRASRGSACRNAPARRQRRPGPDRRHRQ